MQMMFIAIKKRAWRARLVKVSLFRLVKPGKNWIISDGMNHSEYNNRKVQYRCVNNTSLYKEALKSYKPLESELAVTLKKLPI